tara:strand:+ start:535 stop:726 length:192 start_codon:yes stop_codon:yes gene_type:complete
MNTFTNVKWHTDFEGNNIAYKCTKNGQPEVHIPLEPKNSDYIKLKSQIDAGDITVGAADAIVS